MLEQNLFSALKDSFFANNSLLENGDAFFFIFYFFVFLGGVLPVSVNCKCGTYVLSIAETIVKAKARAEKALCGKRIRKGKRPEI